ncbi:MAG: ABC transporter permease, partial [Mesorhizobium sp.]
MTQSFARILGLRAILVLVFAFLYIPIAVLVALSFNQGGLPTVWSGF